MSARTFLPRWIVAWSTTVVLALTVVSVGGPYAATGGGAGQAVALTLVIALMAPLIATTPPSNAELLRDALVAGGVCGFLALFAAGLDAERTALLALGGSVLTLLVAALLRWRTLLAGGARGGLQMLTVMLLLTLAPIYVSPLAELAAGATVLTDLIIALSPVSYLSGLVGFDYLREPWFYRHTGFGALRFSYPSPWLMSACYLLVAGLGAWGGPGRRRVIAGRLSATVANSGAQAPANLVV